MLDTFCWNVRGFNNSIRRSNFRKWFKFSKALFGSIVETWVKEHRSNKIIHSSFPGWNAVSNYEYAVHGRIWVLWDPAVLVSVISKSAQMITCMVKLPHIVDEIVVTFVYAVNCKYRRRNLWQEIKHMANASMVIDKPWLVLGDFNQSLDPSDASTGGSRITGGMQELRDCLLSANLFDLTFKGQHFTWWNNQEYNPIAKKIDRILINDKWILTFPFSFDTSERWSSRITAQAV